MSAEDFLKRLEDSGVLANNVVDALRAQVSRAKSPITAEALAKLLVDKGRIDAGQAEQILSQGPAVAVAPVEAMFDDPGLTPIDAGGLIPLDDVGGLTPIEDAGGLVPLDGGGGLTPLDGGLAPLDSPGLQPLSGGDAWDMNDPMAVPDGSTAQAQPAGPATFKGKKVDKHWSQKMWPFVGAFLLLLLIPLAAWLYFVLGKGDATAMFNDAEKSYSNEQYQDALKKYEDFLRLFPKDDNAGKAQVKRNMSELRIPVASKNWDHALKTAKALLPLESEDSNAVNEARSELGTVLPDIAVGFAEKAKNANDRKLMKELADKADEVMKLIDDPANLPSSIRKIASTEQKIERIKEEIKIIRREIQKDVDLERAVSDIMQLAKSGQTVAAHQTRIELLKKYPDLEDHPKLVAAVKVIVENERGLVQLVNEEIAAQQEDRPRATQGGQPVKVGSVAMTNNLGTATSDAEGEVLAVLAEGAIHGLDGSTGKVLWRRAVGYETNYRPQPMDADSGSDIIAVDGKNNDLLRLRRSDGGLVWRLPIGEPFADPVINKGLVFVATESGKLISVNAETGVSDKYAKFPMPLYVAPGANEGSSYLYQLGSHSNLYILSVADLSCRNVYHVAHKAGQILVAPVYLRGNVLVAVNEPGGYCNLHVLAQPLDTDQKSLLGKAQAPFRLKGHVVLPPVQVFGRMMMVVTDRGGIHFFEETGTEEAPIELVASLEATTDESTPTYATASNENLFVGGDGFAKYEIQLASGKLTPRWRKNPFDTFVGAISVFRDVAIHISRRGQLPGVSVTAVNAESGDMIWRTDLGVPQVGEPLIASTNDKVVSVSGLGNLFHADSAAVQSGYITRPTARPSPTEQPMSLHTRLDFGASTGWIGMPQRGLPESTHMVTLDPARPTAPFRLRSLAVPEGAATANATAFQGGIVIPWNNGQVLLLDPSTGANKVHPFQPPTRPGQAVQWRQATLLPGGEEFVISDSRGKIYRVGIENAPEPHLAAKATANVRANISSALAVAGDTLYARADNQNKSMIVSYGATDLKAGKEFALAASPTWGPRTVGDVVLVVTDDDKLHCFESGQKLRWSVDLDQGPLAGLPAADGEDLLIAYQSGKLWRIAADSGSARGEPIVSQEPFGSGPIAFGPSIWLYGSDGLLLMLPPP